MFTPLPFAAHAAQSWRNAYRAAFDRLQAAGETPVEAMSKARAEVTASIGNPPDLIKSEFDQGGPLSGGSV